VAVHAIIIDGLLSAAIATEHRDSFQLFMDNNRVNDMAVIAAKASTTTTVSVPPK